MHSPCSGLTIWLLMVVKGHPRTHIKASMLWWSTCAMHFDRTREQWKAPPDAVQYRSPCDFEADAGSRVQATGVQHGKLAVRFQMPT